MSESLPIKPLEPVAVLDLFPEELESLLSLLASLSEAEWQAPTVCTGWSVKDIVQHLLADNIGRLSRERDGYVDRSLILPGEDLARWDDLLRFINRQNALWVQATRRISPPLLCELLRLTAEALIAHFNSLDLLALGGPVSWVGPEPAPVWLDVAREYTERWLHQQQIRDAVNIPGLRNRRHFAPVLDIFVRALPHTLRATAAPAETCVQLTITGEAGGTWFAVRTEAKWVLTREFTQAPDASVQIDQESAWRLFTKGITKDAALQKATLAGNLSLAEKVLEMVSIIA